MKKLLIVLALCSMALPSHGTNRSTNWVVMHGDAEEIIAKGITLEQGYDTNRGLVYFVNYCAYDKRKSERGVNQGGGCEIIKAKWQEAMPNGDVLYDGIWVCTVNSEGVSTCARQFMQKITD